MYVDSISLRSYVKELKKVSDQFLVMTGRTGVREVQASYLSLLMPNARCIFTIAAINWPSYGGDHADVLRYLGFGLEELKGQVAAIGGRNRTHIYEDTKLP